MREERSSRLLTHGTPAGPAPATLSATRQRTEEKPVHATPIASSGIVTLVVSMVVVDVSGVVLSWNGAAEALFGWSAQETIGHHIGQFVVAVANQVAPDVVRKQVLAGTAWEGEYRVQRRDGREVSVHVIDSPLFDGTGAVTGILGVAIDVSGERAAAIAVLEAVTENSPTSVTVVGADNRIVLTMGDTRTPRAAKFAYVGRKVSDLVPGTAFLTTLANARSHGSDRQVVSFGDRVYDSTVVRLPDSVAGPGGVAFVASDITDRVAASRRFEALIENVQDDIRILDADGRLLYSSPSALEKWGYSSGEQLLAPRSVVVHPDDRESAATNFESAVAQPDVVIRHEFRVRHADGTWRFVEQSLVNRLADSAIAGIVAITRDVTDYHVASSRMVALNRLHAMLSEAGNAMVRATEPTDLRATLCRILTKTGGFSSATFTGGEPAPSDSAAVVLPVTRRAALPEHLIVGMPDDQATVSDEGMDLLKDLVRDTGFALDTLDVARQREEAVQLATHRAGQQTIISSLGATALGAASTAQVIEEAAAALSRPGRGQVTLAEPVDGSDELLLRVVGGADRGLTAGDRVARALLPISSEVLRTGRSVSVADLSIDARYVASPFPRVGSAVAVPILVGGRTAAVLSVSNSEAGDFDEDDIHFYEAVANVISGAMERSLYEASVHHEAMHDHLTGLTNRNLLQDRLAQALMRRSRHQSGKIALLAVGIDGFKAINSSRGHEAGDELLILFGERLRAVVRPADTVGRLGGDEFVILCEDLQDTSEAATVAGRILEHMRDCTFMVDGSEVAITASIGIAVDVDKATVSSLLRDADAAMYRAKETGRDRYETVDDALRGRIDRRAVLEFALREALAKGEFHVAYQPKVSLTTDRMIGVEALLRWNHPNGSTPPPLEFIPLAEESGLIVPIGAWVLEQVCRDAARWRAVLAGGAPLTVAVNVSPRQFVSGLAASFGQIISDSGIDPKSICLEVTESMVMPDPELAIATLTDLKNLGVQISIDDFGTGLSSLAYLKRFPLDELKIDKSFVDGLGQDPEDTAIVAAVMGMAHALDLRVVAEGVETADQLARLRTLGCDAAQGYYLARPGTAADIDRLLVVEAAGTASSQRTLVDHVAEVPYVARVLVVDDAPDIRQLARASLIAAGFDVTEVATGEDALDLLRVFKPDCVVLDVNLPGISGLDVCRSIRDVAANMQVTIVMVSGNADAAEKVEAFLLKADDYMVKPFSPRDLVGRVTAAMRRRNSVAAEPH